MLGPWCQSSHLRKEIGVVPKMSYYSFNCIYGSVVCFFSAYLYNKKINETQTIQIQINKSLKIKRVTQVDV